MRILYVGGSGNISFECVHESVRRGHAVTVFNRGNRNQGLPASPNVSFIMGDVKDDGAYAALSREHFDVVCQFRAFNPDDVRRDARLFAGRCGLYVFISSASAYEKPPRGSDPITEKTPLVNPFAAYSQRKADAEAALREQDAMPFTIVRPNLTYRTVMPLTALSRPLNVSRLMRGKPVVVHGDGQSLWTVTHAEDFARPFVKLIELDGQGEAYHITRDGSCTWDELLAAGAAALGVEAKVVHVSSDALVRYRPDWRDQLHSDKTPSVTFDNTKIKTAVGDFDCPINPWRGMRMVADQFPIDPHDYDREEDALHDRIISDLGSLGGR